MLVNNRVTSEVKKEVCLLSYQVVGLTAEVHKQLENELWVFTPLMTYAMSEVSTKEPDPYF